MSKPLPISRTSADTWCCRCGNTDSTAGFSACDARGQFIEPDQDWTDLYVSNTCKAIIDANSRHIIGSADPTILTTYVVSWAIDVEAASPFDAAKEAARVMSDDFTPEDDAFTVTHRPTSVATEIDFAGGEQSA